jgi:hypothetical protein
MAQRTREQLNTANAALFVNNETGDITPALEKAFNEDVNDSAVNIKGDTFAADAEFAFQNGSKFREGAIPHGFGGGIARVCANEKADQWEDGFRYLISTSGSTNTVVYAETINNIIPDDTYDETDDWAVGSRLKNLVTGIEYLCTQANEGDAIWIPLSGDWIPSISGGDSNALVAARYSVQGNVVTFIVDFELGNSVTVASNFSVEIQYPDGLPASSVLGAAAFTAVWSDRYGIIFTNGYDSFTINNGGPVITIQIDMTTKTVTEIFQLTISGQYTL